MDAQTIYNVVEKLTGSIEPVADSAIDRKRAENLKLFIEVYDKMHTQLDTVARYNRQSPYGSVKYIVKTINNYLNSLNDDGAAIEKLTEHNANVVSSFIEHVKNETGVVIEDKLFESYFNA